MAVFKCKMCGGDLEIIEGSNVAQCYYCDTKQTVPNADSEKKTNLFNRANRLRMAGEFDKAANIYESILAEFSDEAEAYWGLCLCDYGIEYVDDPATGNKIPTCHRASFTQLQDDSNCKAAIEHADSAAKAVYESEAARIDEIMADILDVSRNESPYDIFICYKETDANGQRTIDSVMAQDLYDVLTQKGYRVFFARITLEDKLGRQYEPYIFAALNSAKVMLVVGTSYDHLHAVWVQNEWSRFLKLMAKDKSKVLIPCYKDMDAYDLPEKFKMLQAQDLGKIGATQDLLRGIDKILNVKTDSPAESTSQPVDELLASRANGPGLIFNVSAIGSNDFNNCWPTGTYAETFNYDEFDVVYFHLRVSGSALRHKTKIKTGMRIRNSKNVIVFDDESYLDWQPNYDRVAKSWIIHGSDGSYVPVGVYHTQFWVENSCVYEFDFKVTSDKQLDEEYQQLEQARIKQGVCRRCGGSFKKGLFGGIKCMRCGKAKDY